MGSTRKGDIELVKQLKYQDGTKLMLTDKEEAKVREIQARQDRCFKSMPDIPIDPAKMSNHQRMVWEEILKEEHCENRK
jgi:hypothetical protein